MAGQVQMCELRSEVSGHHLLLRHWVTESALIIAKRVEARALGLAATGAGVSEEEDEAEEVELGMKWWGREAVGASESLSGGEGEK